MSETPVAPRSVLQTTGLVAGPALAGLLMLALPVSDLAGDPGALTTPGRATLAVMAWMAVWWLTEAVEITVTALLPLALFPVLGVATIKAASAPYASDIIFLFMGGFMLSLSMQRWRLDRRVALLTLRLVGTRPTHMVAGVMLATAVMSAFVSNTATAAMMLPIAAGVIALVAAHPDAEPAAVKNYTLCMLLGIAYAASIGGLSTIIGSPPNGILAGFLKHDIAPEFRQEITFVGWMWTVLPMVVVFLPLTWLLLTRVIHPVRLPGIAGGRAVLTRQYRDLGPAHRGEWATFLVFTLTAAAWITRPLIAGGLESAASTPDAPVFLLPPLVPGLSDAGIAMIGGLALFVIPAGRGRGAVMNWATARRLPWEVLILFGGGLTLAAAIQANGVADFLGGLMPDVQTWPLAPVLRELICVGLITVAVIFLTELTSNTATAATLVPILAALAPGLGVHPYLLIFPATIAASCAFMMPVATPPNAIVFATGQLTIPQMCRAGIWLNLLASALIVLLAFAVIRPRLGG